MLGLPNIHHMWTPAGDDPSDLTWLELLGYSGKRNRWTYVLMIHHGSSGYVAEVTVK